MVDHPTFPSSISHEVEYLQVVTISGYILYLQTEDGSHLCITRTLKFDKFLLKLDRLLHSSQQSVLPVNPVRTTSAGCLRGSRSRPFFTSCHVFSGETVHQTASTVRIHSKRIRQCSHHWCATVTKKTSLVSAKWQEKIYKDIYYDCMSNWTSRDLSSLTNICESLESTGRPCFTLAPAVQCLGSWDSGMVTLSRPLSSPVILALAVGRGDEAPI